MFCQKTQWFLFGRYVNYLLTYFNIESNISDTNVRAKPKGCEKSIFLKRHLEPQTSKSSSTICESEKSGGFRFNFNINQSENEKVLPDDVLEEEDPAAVEKFKFAKSNNSFRFNFSSWFNLLNDCYTNSNYIYLV